MKRAKFLWPLTHGHQHALSAAKIIRERLAVDPSDTRLAEETLRFYESDLIPHFAAEEEMLASAKSRWPSDDPDLKRTLADHQDMRQLAVSGGNTDLLKFTDLLTRHIHFEEEILFARLEALFNQEEVEHWGQKLQASAPSCPHLPAAVRRAKN
jgi:hypothetical protein